MNIIIAGDGEVGMHLAKALEKSDHNITVVDLHEDFLKTIESQADLMTIVGDSASIRVLQQANVKRADLVLCVMRDEHLNILTGILAKKLGAKKVIVRINTMENVARDAWRIYQDLGIDGLVSPEDVASQEIITLLQQNAAMEAFDFSSGKLELFVVKLNAKSEVLGLSLEEVVHKYKHLDFRAVAIDRNNTTFIPDIDDTFRDGDLVYVVTKPHAIKELMELCGIEEININNVMIVGGGRVARLTARHLENDMNIKIIEKNKDRCVNLTELLSNTIVVNGDARNVEFLEEEGLHDMDAFIALTDSTETNILTCLQAKAFGVKKTIALVENIDYIDISQNIGIDTIINKRLITASYMMRYTLGDNVASLKCLNGIDADMIELVVRDGSDVIGKTISKIHMPEGSIIGGIIRGEDSFIAHGNFQFEAEDHVVILTLPGKMQEVENIFK